MTYSTENIGPRAFVNSLPKAGTNLLSRLLLLLGWQEAGQALMSPNPRNWRFPLAYSKSHVWSGRGGIPVGIDMPGVLRPSYVAGRLDSVKPLGFVTGHVPRTEHFRDLLEERQIRMLLMLRDPRDVVVSHAFYVDSNKRHPLHRFYKELGSLDAQLSFSISGGRTSAAYLESIGSRTGSVEAWASDAVSFPLRFEDLIGDAGGGSSDLQRFVVAEMLDFLGVETHKRNLGPALSELFGSSGTFRQGQIGGWKGLLEDHHLAAIDSSCGDFLFRWRYV